MKHVKISILLVSLLFAFSLIAVAQPPKQTALKLNQRQMKRLNLDIPPKVRRFLETADEFEILMDTISEVEEKPVYIPNWRYVVKSRAMRKKVLNSFYRDVARGDGDRAACFYPNHTFVAKKGGKTLEMVICFTCHKFVTYGEFGESSGGMYSEPQSEDLINDLVKKNGVPIK